MSFSFTDIHYGWKLGAGITLATVTIFVAGNTRERINQADVIALVVSVPERCFVVNVVPPEYVRGWVSNAYMAVVTNGVTNWVAVGYTNDVTNAIGWRIDREMLVANDATILSLFSMYLDTNTFADIGSLANHGATNLNAWSQRVTVTNMEERYRLLNMMEMTKFDNAHWTNAEYWSGSGTEICNETNLPADGSTSAYAAAVADYQVRSNGLCAGYTFGQDCIKTTWQEIINVGSNICQTNLIVKTESNFVVVVTNIYFEAGTNLVVETDGLFFYSTNNYAVVQTNIYFVGYDQELIVTNYTAQGSDDLSPNVSGTYIQRLDTFTYYNSSASAGIVLDGDSWRLATFDLENIWTNGNTNVNAVYYPDPATYAVGSVTVEQYGVEHIWPSAPSGIYSNTTENEWTLGEYTIRDTVYGWFIARLYPERCYYKKTDNPIGLWSVWDEAFEQTYFADTSGSSSWEYVTNTVDVPWGLYELDGANVWTLDGWYVFSITTDLWVCHSNNVLDTNGYYFSLASVEPTGTTWEAVNFVTPGATSEWEYVTNAVDLAPTGTYTNDPLNEYWKNQEWKIWDDGSYWVCATNSPIDTEKDRLYFNTAATGVWDTINFTGGATSSWEYVYSNNPVDPSGYYVRTGEKEWRKIACLFLPQCDTNDWIVGVYFGYWKLIGTNYVYQPHIQEGKYGIYMAADPTNTSSYWPPSWSKGDATYHGNYLTAHTSIDHYVSGIATVTADFVYSNIFVTNRHFQCTLSKLGADYAVTNITTQLQHSVHGWYFLPSEPSGYSNNVYDSQGLGYSNLVWTNLFIAGAEYTKTRTVNIGGDLSTPPNESPACTNVGQTTAQGFYLLQNKAVLDWIFLYATNRYW